MITEDQPVLSIIIPTLNEEANINATLTNLNKSDITCSFNIIIVDGGSQDATVCQAQQQGAQIIKSESGRGKQLAAGGKYAKGTWFLFLHADTILETGWFREVEQFITDVKEPDRAAVFSFKLDEDNFATSFLETIVKWRTHKLALPYGDQGLLISNELYHNLEGYAPISIMEDVEIVRRIGRSQLHVFKSHAITSSHKYRRDGYILRTLRNFLCLTLYFLGFQPHWISKIY